MLHANPLIRRIWVALIAAAFLSACAPSRPTTEKPELKNGQQVSEAAAQSTHETDIDALVLSSSSMDDEAVEEEDEQVDAPVDPPPSAPDAGRSDAEDAHDEDASEDTDADASHDINIDIDTDGAPE